MMTGGAMREGTRVSGWQSCLFACLVASTFLFPPGAQADNLGRINVVLSEATPAYREVAESFIASLGGKFTVNTRLLADARGIEAAAPKSEKTLVVPVGVQAMREIYGSSGGDATVLSLLVPRATAQSLTDSGLRTSAVYIDQPPARSLALAKLLLPHAKRVGILLSGETADASRAFAAEAARAKMEVIVEPVGEAQDIPQALQRLLPRIDVLLLIPDSTVVSENTVRHILLASYRRRIPVIGFSRGLANAGAVASVVSDPAGIGREGAILARQWNPLTGALPPARNSGEFDLVINRQVARSLGIEVPSDNKELSRWQGILD
jgi:ABC-type uncharacterized transport system substrate-binding protein